jgi:hypothetical protein
MDCNLCKKAVVARQNLRPLNSDEKAILFAKEPKEKKTSENDDQPSDSDFGKAHATLCKDIIKIPDHGKGAVWNEEKKLWEKIP